MPIAREMLDWSEPALRHATTPAFLRPSNARLRSSSDCRQLASFRRFGDSYRMDSLQIVEGGWEKAASGVPLIVAGTAFAAAATLLQPLVLAGFVLKMAIISFGLAFAFNGIWRCIGRVVFVFDGKHGLIRRSVRLLFAQIRETEFSAAQFSQIRVYAVLGGPIGAVYRWRIQLKGSDLTVELRFGRARAALDAAKTVGECLSLPVLVDHATSGGKSAE